MDIITITLIIFAIAIVVFAIVHVLLFWFASKSIFTGSGAPTSMANVFRQSMMTAGQVVIGLSVLAIITVLMVSGKISSEVGLPIITAITTAFVVVKHFGNGHAN